MDLSKTIKDALFDSDINPSVLARMTGYSPQHIHNLLKGKKRWNEDSIQKVCTVLGLEISFHRRNT